jgi:hypothetical protein
VNNFDVRQKILECRMRKMIAQGLRQNALDSMEEALKKFQEGLDGSEKSLKFSILNISHFVELSFKYFISKINQIFIYEKPCAEKLNNTKTISFWDSINLYKNLNPNNLDIMYDKELRFIENMNWLKKIRNEIAHNEFEMDIEHTRNNLGRILAFMNQLYISEGESSLDKSLSANLKDLFNFVIDEFKRKLSFAKYDAKNEADKYYQSENQVEPDSNNFGEILRLCSSCENKTLTYRSEEDKYYCHFCNEFDEADTCFWCNEKFPRSQTIEGLGGEGTNYCSSNCLNNDMDRK